MKKNPLLVYVGLDDTDNLHSRGTGFRARQLVASIVAEKIGSVLGVTRHQLLVSPEIPYTSHNSSACLLVSLSGEPKRNLLISLCRRFLERESAPGSDAGFCVWPSGDHRETLLGFGLQAKREVVTADAAHRLADCFGCHLEGVTGDHGGVIGALAAVGLRAGGFDGRFIWVAGLREMAGMTLPLENLLTDTGIDSVQTLGGRVVDDPLAHVDLGEWPRPLLRSHRAALLVEKCDDTPHADWRVVSKAYIKRF